MTVGSANVNRAYDTLYFSGYIDELIIFRRVKIACQILNDVTLAAYVPFDSSYTDAGPNSLTLTASGASFINGYTNQDVYLSVSQCIYSNKCGAGPQRSNPQIKLSFIHSFK
jgi:hypothetical protein